MSWELPDRFEIWQASDAVLPMRLPIGRAMRWIEHTFSRFPNSTRFGGKMHYHLVNGNHLVEITSQNCLPKETYGDKNTFILTDRYIPFKS